MAFINAPTKFTKDDIKNCGIIYKDERYSYVLTDLYNTNLKNTLKLNGYGFYNYVYDICNTYLFIIGNQIKNKSVNPNKIDFLEKLLKFEYFLQKNDKNVKSFDIPSNRLVIITHEKWLNDNLTEHRTKDIENIIINKKTHLQTTERPYIKHLKYLCDNENNIGLFKHGLCLDLLTDNYVKILKDTSFDGYIIKYNHSEWL